ncbi:MAG: N-acetylglucosaminyldiphosphoundecaprenol N-acetyl-beta-D-mannosaminyltransferase [Patescibacteria group bacterium]|jgi:N-acetylglucosaminyldiphosphoundecaprenol N-acetyl-beta-D-mannosaminyltransferase|nr:N-acetylglucosaminyldiphosphoundecaprenol N-acetyl-beta-D-mannosaminyltransferase [Patescibacteria group bacterium]
MRAFSMATIQALGIKIDNVSLLRAKRLVSRFLSTLHYHQVVTVNPDFIMTARRNKEFRSAVNGSDLVLADGVGIHLPAFLQGKKLSARIPGVDFSEYILAYAQEMGLHIFLATRNDGLSSYVETKAAILVRYPHLNIHGCDVNIHSQRSLKNAQKKVRGDIVLVNFGTPVQDIFLAQLRYIPEQKVRLGIGVGGTFDFWTGKQTRAPIFIQKMGMEWFFRLILQPRRRFKRTFNYVVVFSFLCLWEALRKKARVFELSLRHRMFMLSKSRARFTRAIQQGTYFF